MKDLTGTGTAGIRYNHLDKPEEIRIVGKGTIKIQYDAGGAKLKREFVPENAGQGTRVVWYLGGYQYEEIVGGNQPRPLSLSFIGFADGRIRAYQPQGQVNTWGDEMVKQGSLAMPGGLTGAVDYFISDHRTDVRMILTEEQQYSVVNASMETDAGRANDEAGLFGAAVAAARVPRTTAAGWTANTSQQIMRLNGNGQRIGPSQLLKVMAGDLIHTSANYYHTATASNTAGSSISSTVVSSLVGLLSGGGAASSLVKNNAAAIGTSLSGAPTLFTSLVSPDITSASGTLPKAYLCIAFFDERFTFVPEASQSIRVGAAHVNSMANPLALTNIRVPRNGYCFIYLINESGVDVFFDNLRVRHDRGRILEENHYYPFGLRIDGLSSRAFGGAQNNYQYQGDFSEFDDDLGWNDFELRSYDPQIGRFLQYDPYSQFASGYVGMGNDPGNMVDEDGGCAGCSALGSTTGVDVVVTGTRKIASGLSKAGSLTSLRNGAYLSTVSSIGGASGLSFGGAGMGLSTGMDGWLVGQLSGLAYTAAGMGTAVLDNFSLGLLDFRTAFAPNGEIDPEAASSYQNGQLAGDAASMALAVLEGGFGEGLAGASGVVTLGTLGASAPVTVPTAAIGVGLMAHSVVVFGRAGKNLINDVEQVNAEPANNLPEQKFEPVQPSPENRSINGRSGKQQKLKEVGNDPKASSSDRGWIKQERNSIKRGSRKNIRVPPGKNLAHKRGKEARKGNSYKESHMQDIDLHKNQHRVERIKRKGQ